MKVLLTGAGGQLGKAFISERFLSSSELDLKLISCTRKELDLADPIACKAIVARHRPDWVLNAGAYTAVDRAESESELAEAVNAGAPAAFAEALAEFGGRLFQISTDFVFNGNQGTPYLIDHPIDPLSVYGSTKAAGEIAALQLPGAMVLRTSWVYGPIGSNFCLSMLRLHASRASSGDPLFVVADQVGCPTSTKTLAKACWRGINLEGGAQASRRLHWSDAGAASWYDFAVAIGELGVQMGLLERAAEVCPITTKEYSTPAKRPSYSLLDCSSSYKVLSLQPSHWRTELSNVLSEVKSNHL